MGSELMTRRLGSAQMATLREKHRLFWEKGEGGFLRASNVFAPSLPSRLPQRDGSFIERVERLSPDMIDVALLIEEVADWDPSEPDALESAKSQVLAFPGVGDLMPYCRPFFKIPWLEAMLGCPIKMTEGQIWVERYAGDVDELIRRGGNINGNPWLELYVEFLRQLQERLQPPYLASTNTLLRGPSDLVAAILGVKEACIGWLEDPKRMAALMRVCTDAHLAVVEAGYRAIKPFAGGYMSGYGVWSPQPVARMQADHSSLLSPSIYERQILPYDREIIQACPICLFHIHNNGYHIAPLLAQVEELDAIEVVVDPYPRGQRKAHEISMMQMIQQHKPLMVDVNFPSPEEANWMIANLDRTGLYFNAQFAPEILTAMEASREGQIWLLEA